MSHINSAFLSGRPPRLAISAAFLLCSGVAVVQSSSQSPPAQASPFTAQQVQAGQTLFTGQCGFCHGRDGTGGPSGPDLTESALVAEDVRGDKLVPLIRNGRVDKGMPPFNLSDPDMTAVVAYIHSQKAKLDAQPGRRRRVTESDLLSGNAEAGKQYFSGAGGCTKCHSATGDLAGVGARFRGLALMQQMLAPRRTPAATTPGVPAAAATAPREAPVKVTVTLPSGATVTGPLAYRDEFTIALTDSAGWYRSWPASQVKFTIENRLDAHVEQLAKYSEKDMHDVYAFLLTLR